MKFLAKNILLPEDETLLNNINEAATRLFNKLIQLNIKTLEISEYNKKYLGRYLAALESILITYSYILAWTITNSKISIKDFVLIDYGGGSGMLSLLAKELGVGLVVYNDIYEMSCRDSRTIAKGINNEANYYINGEIDDVIEFLESQSLSCNAIASHDVIEHIYNVDYFIKKISHLSDDPYKIVMSTGANPYNPYLRRKLMRKQKIFEYQDRAIQSGHKTGHTSKAYFSIRKEIITAMAPELTDVEIYKLTKASRGLIETDIKKLINKYLATGQIPHPPEHPTNTCDPYTGNWAEHLMDISQLKDILTSAGFNVQILSGYYDGSSNNAIKQSFGKILNPMIRFLNSKGLIIAPYITIYAEKEKF